ncbi:unnamed protein product [Fusarium graminearum]|nr:unnamed protein product [Fusarium graminearum]
MHLNHTAALQDFWGFKCARGSKFYICENSWAEFFGCCTSDPCADGIGVCPPDNVKALTFDAEKASEMPWQDCLTSSTSMFQVCAYVDPPFLGCCASPACEKRCGAVRFSGLSQNKQNRRNLLYPKDLNLTEHSPSKVILEPISTLPPSPFAISYHHKTFSRNTALIGPGAMAAICIAVLFAVVICLGIIARYFKRSSVKSMHKNPTYIPIISQEAVDEIESPNAASIQTVNDSDSPHLASDCKPITVTQSKMTFFIGWAWDIVLTLIPICFIESAALAIAVVGLDGQKKSDYGQHVLELTRLGPSLYPILFAAVAGRFYRNLARWRLEQPGGVSLAVLEQVFGSQSFATALERVFVVHTHVFLGILILSTWALSPLGGQSSSRILSFGDRTEVSNGTISYLHPAYQVTSYINRNSYLTTRASIAALYSSCLLSSPEQKRSPRDLWDLPKIPQWKSDKKVGETYPVDNEALRNGRDDYASLIGIKLRGLDFEEGLTQYNFTVQTSYIDLQCLLENDDVLDPSRLFNDATMAPSTDLVDFRVHADIKSSLPWTQWKGLDNPPPLQLFYIIKWEWMGHNGYSGSAWSAINCTMQSIWMDTEFRCGPRPSAKSCYAYQQRRVNDKISPNRLPRLMTKNHGALRQAISVWPEASSDWTSNKPSATENYIMGEMHPYAGQGFRNWTEMDREKFPAEISRRMTTAFNTFWDATLNPTGHTNITFKNLDDSSTAFEDEFNAQPFMNTTVGTMTAEREVYRANQLWLAILLTITLFLQILAILGLVLEVLIVGPDVLGYASSFTRDNPYVRLPTTGSSLGGPERARALRNLRLQLTDVCPDDEIGYLAICAIPTKAVDQVTEQGSTENVDQDRVSGQALSRKLDSKRLYR